ncbi:MULTISPECIES: hypothetical protein [unclassified Mesorhizobium]|uniref:hypothetical protein n=1 Tax=unclassified Mesorhizobium TaxID=325217 RepID=UPI00333A9DEF
MAERRISVTFDADGEIVVYARTRSGKPLSAIGRGGFDDMMEELAHDEDFHDLIDAATSLIRSIPNGRRVEIEDLGGLRFSIFDLSGNAVFLDLIGLDNARETLEGIPEAARSVRDPGSP